MPASSAVDAGSATKLIKFDYGMGARPANEKYDVGAYEHGATPYQPQLNLKTSLSTTGFKLNHNPTDDNILIRVPKNHSARRATLTLYNGEGRVVAKKKAKIRSGESSYKKGNLQLSVGVYYLHFESGDGKTELFRIVKSQ